MTSITALKLGVAALVGVGAVDLAWINLSLGPRALFDNHEPTIADARGSATTAATPKPAPAIPAAAAPHAAAEPAAAQGASATTIEHLYFGTMSKRLIPTARTTLDRITVRAGPRAVIEIEGHADYRGYEAYNLDLSKDRTDAAAAYLIKRGIAPDRIKREYLGARGTTKAPDSELWRDRRVDVRIIEGGIE